jgi:uncharacterized membrane protein
MALAEILIIILAFLILYILFALPLYLGLLLMGRHQSIFKVGIVTFLAVLINGAVIFLFSGFLRSTGFIGMLIPFLITVLFYREMFKIKFWRAFFVLILQYIFAAVIYFIAVIFGITAITALILI